MLVPLTQEEQQQQASKQTMQSDVTVNLLSDPEPEQHPDPEPEQNSEQHSEQNPEPNQNESEPTFMCVGGFHYNRMSPIDRKVYRSSVCVCMGLFFVSFIIGFLVATGNNRDGIKIHHMSKVLLVPFSLMLNLTAQLCLIVVCVCMGRLNTNSLEYRRFTELQFSFSFRLFHFTWISFMIGAIIAVLSGWVPDERYLTPCLVGMLLVAITVQLMKFVLYCIKKHYPQPTQ